MAAAAARGKLGLKISQSRNSAAKTEGRRDGGGGSYHYDTVHTRSTARGFGRGRSLPNFRIVKEL